MSNVAVVVHCRTKQCTALQRLATTYDAKPPECNVCNVHKALVDDVDLHKLAAAFVEDPKCAEIFSTIGSRPWTCLH